MPKALISDRGTHFCIKIMERTMKRYRVNHRFSTSYHPQTSGQVENTNRALKRMLEKTVKDNPTFVPKKTLITLLWAFPHCQQNTYASETHQSDIDKVGMEALVSYLVAASMVQSPENARFIMKLKKLIAKHPDQEKLDVKEVKLVRALKYKMD
ncbi:reverse transcriptase domain-containing protein [Tanacetum coccineum]